MTNYRRAHPPSGAVFLPLTTFNRRPLFANPEHVQRLRWAMATVKAEMTLDITVNVGWALPTINLLGH